MPKTSYLPVLILALGLSGCATWSNSNVGQDRAPAPGEPLTASAPAKPVNPASTPIGEIPVVEGEIDGRSYEVIQDLEVAVHKTLVFLPDPTPAQAEQKLREAAAEVGADAVVQARYSPVRVTFVSWGTLEATGKAVRFTD